jgi:hypothetical protein
MLITSLLPLLNVHEPPYLTIANVQIKSVALTCSARSSSSSGCESQGEVLSKRCFRGSSKTRLGRRPRTCTTRWRWACAMSTSRNSFHSKKSAFMVCLHERGFSVSDAAVASGTKDRKNPIFLRCRMRLSHPTQKIGRILFFCGVGCGCRIRHKR